MRSLVTTVFALACALCAVADELRLSDVVKASLVFQGDSNPTRHYPHVLRVFLRLQNAYNRDVTWVANDRIDIRAELFHADGRPVQSPPGFISIISNPTAHRLPYGSQLDLLVSSLGGVSLGGDFANTYVLIIGTRGWLIPIQALETSSLAVNVNGIPLTEDVFSRDHPTEVLFELKPMKITLTK